MKCDLVIWDFNGTIIDDVRLGIDSVNTMLAARGLATISGVGFDFDAEPYEKLAHEWVALYNAGADRIEPTPGVCEAIREIHAARLPQIIISASEEQMMLRALDRFGLTPYFDEIIGQDNIYAAGKLESARRFGERCGAKTPVVIGDTPHDVEMAHALGARCILYRGGHSSPSALESSGALLVDDLRDAAKAVLEG